MKKIFVIGSLIMAIFILVAPFAHAQEDTNITEYIGHVMDTVMFHPPREVDGRSEELMDPEDSRVRYVSIKSGEDGSKIEYVSFPCPKMLLEPSEMPSSHDHGLFDINGDLRLRYRYDNRDRHDNAETYRLRLGTSFDVDTKTSINLRFNTEEIKDTTTNTRIMGFDVAEVDYQPIYTAHNSLEFVAGKINSPFYRTGIFDDDLSFEGAGMSYQYNPALRFLSNYYLGINAGYFDNVMTGVQGLIQTFNPVELTVGGSFYNYQNQQNTPSTYETFASIGFEKIPVDLSGNYTRNHDGDESWSAGIQLGQIDDPRDIDLYFRYHNNSDNLNAQMIDREWSTIDGQQIGADIRLTNNIIAGIQYNGNINHGESYHGLGDITVQF